MSIFSAESKDIAYLKYWMKHAPRKFRYASALWLNKAAYITREKAKENVSRDNTIRKPSFVRASLQYTKVKRGVSFNEMVSYAGSVRLRGQPRVDQRYEGFRALEGLPPVDRNMVTTKAARGGRYARSMIKKARFHPGQQFIQPSWFPAKGGNNSMRMLKQLTKQGYKKPFMLYHHGKAPAGLYMLQGKKLKALRLFGQKPKDAPERKWLEPAAMKFIHGGEGRRAWHKVVEKVLEPKKLKKR